VCVWSCWNGWHEKQKKKVGERQKGRATWEAIGRGESLILQPLQTTSGSRSLLPSPWGFDCSKSLLASSRFFYFLFLFFPYFLYFIFNKFKILDIFLFFIFFLYTF
jgi:hypothetical protein